MYSLYKSKLCSLFGCVVGDSKANCDSFISMTGEEELTTSASKPTLFSCNFESECPVILLDGISGGNWSVIDGPTPSEGTGPLSGVGGEGRYIYYEASNLFPEGNSSR